jgi:ABC-type polysaccharide/polyol phosphate transport system ATPase subunit
MSNTVISVENISKKYRLGVITRRDLVDQIESWVARKTGRPDPHASVFEDATDRMPTPYDFWALKDISFKVNKGDIVGILGRNGSGKSTLLKILSRITAPTSGKARLKGRLASLLEVGTGFNYELTGRENVYLSGSILGLKNKEIEKRWDSIVDFAEIPNFIDTPVKRYSSGMRVRLAFAVAAHLDPEILILDEVLAVGDAKFQEKCIKHIENIKNSGVTVLFVSHSAQTVLSLCTRGIVLQEGRIIAEGTSKEAASAYLKSLHLNTPENVLSGYPESRVGQFAGKVAELLLNNLSNGQLVFNIPVETAEGIRVIDVGWVSNSRMKSLRTEPSWNAAPDISVSIVSVSRSEEDAGRGIIPLMNAAAREVWIVHPDGSLVKHKQRDLEFIISNTPDRISLMG